MCICIVYFDSCNKICITVSGLKYAGYVRCSVGHAFLAISFSLNVCVLGVLQEESLMFSRTGIFEIQIV